MAGWGPSWQGGSLRTIKPFLRPGPAASAPHASSRRASSQLFGRGDPPAPSRVRLRPACAPRPAPRAGPDAPRGGGPSARAAVGAQQSA